MSTYLSIYITVNFFLNFPPVFAAVKCYTCNIILADNKTSVLLWGQLLQFSSCAGPEG